MLELSACKKSSTTLLSKEGLPVDTGSVSVVHANKVEKWPLTLVVHIHNLKDNVLGRKTKLTKVLPVSCNSLNEGRAPHVSTAESA